MNKLIFLSRLQGERDKFELLLNRAGFLRQLTMAGVFPNLSIKDLLADALCREQFIGDRLSEILHGEPYAPCVSHSAFENFQKENGYPDYESPLCRKEKPNPLVVEKYKNVSLDDIVEQELAAYISVVSAMERLTQNQCLDHDLFHRVAEQTYKTYRRASAEIQRWQKSIAAEPK
jgi:hypothetical protein